MKRAIAYLSLSYGVSIACAWAHMWWAVLLWTFAVGIWIAVYGKEQRLRGWINASS